jgi:hypothetical protein
MATSDLHAAPTTAPPSLAPPAGHGGVPTPTGDKEFALFGEDGFTFADLLDIVNPLQHIPVIGTLYRRITGDTLDPGARLAGGALFGGPIGVAVAGLNAALEDATGKDAGAHVLALFEGGDAPPATAVADTGNRPATVPDLALLGPLPAMAAEAPPAAAPTPKAPIDLAAVAPLAPTSSAALVAAMPDAGRAGFAQAGVPAGKDSWFTQTMLAALERYQDAARLAAEDDMAAVTTAH